eukprot:1103134-Pyramimonas_sp.AAC.1
MGGLFRGELIAGGPAQHSSPWVKQVCRNFTSAARALEPCAPESYNGLEVSRGRRGGAGEFVGL